MTLSAMRPLGAGALLVMLAAIGAAWGFQLIGGIAPCPLCLEQRVPYYVGIPLATAALFVAPRVPRLARVLLVGAAAAMIWTAGLGIYHAGAEWAFWPGPNTCAAGAAQSVRDASSLLSTLEETTLVTCTQDTGRVLGLSFAGWNVLAASGAAILLAAAALRPAGGA